MARNPRVGKVQAGVARYNRAHPRAPIDAAAELAVARQEGLGGGIGDNGTSFGANQLHYGGAYPAFAPRGAGASQAWAWSPQGIDYTLGEVGKVAGGLRGPAAVRAIVSKFERPANPQREIANALSAYGSSSPAPMRGPAMMGPGPTPTPAGGGDRRRLLLELAAGFDKPGLSSFTPIIKALAARNAPPVAPAPLASAEPTAARQGAPARDSSNPGVGGVAAPGSLAELLHEGIGGPTHSTGEHIHFASTNPQTELASIRLAQQLGLQVRENPYTDPVDPVHAAHSYHYRTFPGRYDGRRLGQAADASGESGAMNRLFALLQQRYGR